MDYLRWELERQRAVLAALLLGGGNARDGETIRDGTRQNGAGTPEPYVRRSQRTAAAWEAVRADRKDLEDGRAEAAGTPVSAWEAVLGGETVRTARLEDRKGGGTGRSETPVSAWKTILGGETDFPVNSAVGAWLRLGGGTGAHPEFPRLPKGHMARSGTRQTETDLTAKTQAIESGRDDAGDRAASPETGTNQNRAAGNSRRFFSIRRGGEHTAYTLDLDGATAPQELEKRTAPWGTWGTAVLRAEDSARLLSRAVQRDARRYDGGFNIF